MVFNKLPQDYQFYQREEDNYAHIKIKGVIELSDWSYVSVVISKDGKPYAYTKDKFSYSKDNLSIGTFQISMDLKSELAEYDCKFYAIRNASDSVLMATRTNIVVGDSYIVNGQSNSYARFEFPDSYKGKFSRSFGRFYSDYFNYDKYLESDTLWSLANVKSPVGQFAGELMRLIIENEKVPVCIINGGSGGSNMDYNLIRNPSNPIDFNLSSGRLLYRVQKAGLDKKIKAYIYRQGENDANAFPILWKDKFLSLVEYVKIEYPSLKKIYLPQINATSGNEVNQEILRNDQRNVTSVDGFIKGFATIGTSGFDGVHYNTQGYNQSGLELYRILAEDFYGRPHNQLNYSPNITQIQYLNNQKTKFFIEFDKGQKIITPKDTLLKDKNGLDVLKKPFESFYFKDSGFPTESSKEENIKKIYGKNNYLYFELNSAPTKDILTYLPAYSSEINLIPICSGPFIKNELGMRAFSFVNEKIKNYLPIKENDLDGDLIPDDVDDCPSIVNPTISDIIVENDFTLTINSTLKSIWYLNGIPIEGENKNKLITYKPGEYSVQLISDNGCSSLKSKTYNKIILGKKEEVEFDVFPNPISNQFLIRNRTSSDLLEKVIIYDILGKEVLNIHSISGDLLINAENWPTGKYFLNGYTSTEKKYHFQIIKE